MPQPVALDDLQQPLIESYRRSWEAVRAEQEKIALNPLNYRRRQRLVEVQRSIEASMSELDAQAGEWVANQLPRAYAAGMVSAEGASSPIWTQIHQQAVQNLSNQLFDELLQATDGVRDSTKKLIRSIAKDQALQKAIQGKTADQAAKEMKRVIGEHGISSITYSNGTKHGLAEYSEMAMRTTTAKAYNSGTLGSHADVGFFEIFDGPNCGLSFHDDPTLALGMVVDRNTAEKYLISHPRCRRSFGPRPDVATSEQADKASPSTTPEQTQAQLEQDALRGDPEAIRELEKTPAVKEVAPEFGNPIIVDKYGVKNNKSSMEAASLNFQEDKLASQYDAWGKGLNSQDRAAFTNYQIESYRDNMNLRKGVETANQKQLDAAIDGAPPLGQVGDVYRTVDQEILKGLKAGDIFEDRAFLSTTIDRNFAEQFAEDSGFDNPAIMKIRVLPRQRGAWIDAASDTQQSTQGEILLGRRTPLTYLGKAKNGDYLFIAAGRAPSAAVKLDTVATRQARVDARAARLQARADKVAASKPKAAALEGLDAHAFLSSSYSTWLKRNATEVEKAALARYTLVDVYKTWNPYLRGEAVELSEKDIIQIEALKTLIARSPTLPSDVVVYRGIRDAKTVFGDGSLPPGFVFKDDAFLSTTMDNSIRDYYKGEDGAVMVIRTPEGTRVAIPETEGQLVLSPGTELRVISDVTETKIIDQKGYDLLIKDGLEGEALQAALIRYRITKEFRTIELQAEKSAKPDPRQVRVSPAAERRAFQIDARLQARADKVAARQPVIPDPPVVRRALTAEEKTTITRYTSSDYGAINSHLRGTFSSLSPRVQAKWTPAGLQEEVDIIKRAMYDSPAPLKLYRRFHNDLPMNKGVISEWKVGEIVTEPGFLSTSKTLLKDDAFGNWTMEIEVPKGVRLRDLGHDFTSEKEVLFAPGTRLEVVSKKGTHVKVRVVPPEPVNPRAIARQARLKP